MYVLYKNLKIGITVSECSSTCMLLSPVKFIVEDTAEQRILFLTICLEIFTKTKHRLQTANQTIPIHNLHILLLKKKRITVNFLQGIES